MAAKLVDTNWMWHPNFTEKRSDTAGLFVHFRKSLVVEELPTSPLKLQITADTRYKLYVNSKLIAIGPVKGDQKLWFYDELDLTRSLRIGENKIAVHVLRFFHATPYAPSFPRLPVGGLMIKPIECGESWTAQLQSSSSWETAIDLSAILPTNNPEDDFLHIYENHNTNAISSQKLEWMSAKVHEFQTSTGLGSPWKLSPRMIPPLKFQSSSFSALHNIKSPVPGIAWEETLLRRENEANSSHKSLCLQAQTSHFLELEVENHTTAFLRFRFRRPKNGGSVITITYAESYEDPPRLVPYLRTKENRRDDTKALYGPQDVYTFRGTEGISTLGYDENEATEETFIPFHFRTFRFIGIQINVGTTDLVLEGIEITPVNYPLEVSAYFNVGKSQGHETVEKLWQTSLRTLSNCMHDCYEDCPFYEQLQYAMDMRSSALFTYYVSGDDRLARQALIQIHSSFEPRIGLTSSRSPCHQPQLIPHFSLYWICAISDHYTFFGDVTFLRQFIAVIDGILEFFASRIDPAYSLVSINSPDSMWDFTDWTDQWRPYGIPPAATRTGFSTYTNSLYAYTLKNAAVILQALGRSCLAAEYKNRGYAIVKAVQLNCFDGTFFTDGLAKTANQKTDYSVHSQVFAILSGAASGPLATSILTHTLSLSPSPSPSLSPCASPPSPSPSRIPSSPHPFTQPSTSFSFYTLRALSLCASLSPNISPLYTKTFDPFFSPWRSQLAQNLTTWEEDPVSQRSDCHAWGCAPLYEFLAEVAGVSPAEPGWAVARFRPRLELFAEVRAGVPVGGGAVLDVEWERSARDRDGEGDVVVRLRMRMRERDGRQMLPVVVELPGMDTVKVVCGVGREVRFVVKLGAGAGAEDDRARANTNSSASASPSPTSTNIESDFSSESVFEGEAGEMAGEEKKVED